MSAVAEAWALLWACRVGLWFAPFPQVLRGAQFWAGRIRSRRRLEAAEAMGAIRRALPLTLRASCLTQALAGWVMLTRHGTASRVKIGVAWSEQNGFPGRGFRAHAWLEAGGQVILGDMEEEMGTYRVIWTLPAE